MSGRRRLMMKMGAVAKELILEMGLDNRIRFQISGDAIVANTGNGGWSYGGIGTHHDLPKNYPDLYFGAPKCYADGKVWDLREPLLLGFAPAGIAKVELLECGRNNVAVGEKHGLCYIVWTDGYVDIVDDDFSSSRYLIKITFK